MSPVINKLLAWYQPHKRDLPWRKTRNPYRIYISELMFQQTQVDRVIPIYRAWLKQFPTWDALASATTAEVIHAWAGLGYNRRALYAHEAARYVSKSGVLHGEKAWRKLKGVGPYTSAALAEFVDHEHAIVIDTNIRRVTGRVFFGRPFSTSQDDYQISVMLIRTTATVVAHWDIPQAFMDLAHAVCTSRLPHCSSCPLKSQCRTAKTFLSGKTVKRNIQRVAERIHAEKRSPDRIYRGRILAWIRDYGPTRITEIGYRIDETFNPTADTDWLISMLNRMIADGLLVRQTHAIVSLPNS